MVPIYTEQLSDDVSFDMIYVEGGEFVMGANDCDEYEHKPAHRVRLDSFYIGKYPVTQWIWKAVMKGEENPSFFQGDDRPVETVSWDKVQDFLLQLQEIKRKKYRLPTEAEWEYAAKGGIKSKDFWYAGSNKATEVGWYSENSHKETKVVGQKPPNELGIYEMSGNIWEWCQDWFSHSYYEECAAKGIISNPPGPYPEEQINKVVRGGGWTDSFELFHPMSRNLGIPSHGASHFGFRLALSCSQLTELP